MDKFTKNLCLGNQKPKHAENGIKWLLWQDYTILYYTIEVIWFFAL